MPRSSEKNAQVREARKQQILDAALSVYIRYGYHGCDMDIVAEEAQLAKGLLYYYYKTKKELFTELFVMMFDKGFTLSNELLNNADEAEPVELLMRYAYGMFEANRSGPRMMQFFLRAPFDAYAIFGSEQWGKGMLQSKMHREAVTNIIEQGIAQGVIPAVNACNAANSFWSVFVANLFEYSKLIMGTQDVITNEIGIFREIVRFCFQGLGIEYVVWNSCLENILGGSEKGGCTHEGL